MYVHCMYMYVCMYVYVGMYVCMYVGMYVCRYVCMYVYMYVCTCMYVCMYERLSPSLSLCLSLSFSVSLCPGAVLGMYQLHYAPGYTQSQLLCLITELFDGVPEPFEVFYCRPTTTREELKMFMERVKHHPLPYLILQVNKLPFKLQEVDSIINPFVHSTINLSIHSSIYPSIQ